MNALNELWQAEKKQRILVLCNENEIPVCRPKECL